MELSCEYFFFQAEDGIRDVAVTGVQTCALPIYARPDRPRQLAQSRDVVGEARAARPTDLRARRRDHPARWRHASRLLPPEPPEHQHRQTDARDVAPGVRAGATAARYWTSNSVVMS